MKRINLKISVTLLAIIVTTLYVGTSVASNVGKESTEAASSQEETPGEEVKTAKLEFKKDKIYEIIYFTFNKNNEKGLYENYFPKAFPIFEKYGRKFFAWFNVIEGTSSENLQASTSIVIVEWPNYAAYEMMNSDEEYKKIALYRNGGFTFFQHGWFSTAEDKTVEVREDKAYEFVGATLHQTEEAKTSLDKYFEISEPIKRSYGGSYPEFALEMKPVDSKGAATYYSEVQLIVEWDNETDSHKLFANEEFLTKAMPLMQKAVRHSDYIYTKYKF